MKVDASTRYFFSISNRVFIHFLWSPGGIYGIYKEYTRTPQRLYSYVWESVTYNTVDQRQDSLRATLAYPAVIVQVRKYQKIDMTSMPQTAPPHTDIISFVDEFWPDILLMEPILVSDSLDKSDSGGGHWDGVWGLHSVALMLSLTLRCKSLCPWSNNG
jgi:hypothetical protein